MIQEDKLYRLLRKYGRDLEAIASDQRCSVARVSDSITHYTQISSSHPVALAFRDRDYIQKARSSQEGLSAEEAYLIHSSLALHNYSIQDAFPDSGYATVEEFIRKVYLVEEKYPYLNLVHEIETRCLSRIRMLAKQTTAQMLTRCQDSEDGSEYLDKNFRFLSSVCKTVIDTATKQEAENEDTHTNREEPTYLTLPDSPELLGEAQKEYAKILQENPYTGEEDELQTDSS